YFYKRILDQNDEQRIGARATIGRRFGERWVGNLTFRYENVEITNIELGAPADIFAVQGPSQVSGIGINFTRTTLDSRLRPTRGSKLSAGVERVGALGGDYEFTKLSFSHQVYLP